MWWPPHQPQGVLRDHNAVAIKMDTDCKAHPYRARDLGPQRPAEATADLGHDPLAQARGVIVRERPLRRGEDDAQRDRLPPRADLLAAVDVEDACVAELRPGRLPHRLDQLGGRKRL